MAEEKASLDTAKRLVEELYSFRDRYFESHSVSEATQKNNDVALKLKEILPKLDELDAKLKCKAEYHLLRGKALNVLPSHSPEAEESLSKAVKLDPKLGEAWVCLGESYWKKQQIDSAHNCFLGALNHSKDKVALRNLSMVMRHLGSDADEKLHNIEESIVKAKEAVQMDLTDGTSWFVLGNAYLSQFFAGGQSPAVMKQCLSAYQQAERDIVSSTNPDLHYNRASVYQFQEDYELAMVGYNRASALEPDFYEPREKLKMLLQHLAQCTDLTRSKGKQRDKKLHTLLKNVNEKTQLEPLLSGDGSTARLVPVVLLELVAGKNLGKAVLGVVVCLLHDETNSVAFIFWIVDKSLTCHRVTVYNVSRAWSLKVGDCVAIPQPTLCKISVENGDQSFRFDSIRIDNPMELLVNGRRIKSEHLAPCTASLQAHTD